MPHLLVGGHIYEQGLVPGKNVAGDQLTTQRDDMINEMNVIRMT